MSKQVPDERSRATDEAIREFKSAAAVLKAKGLEPG